MTKGKGSRQTTPEKIRQFDHITFEARVKSFCVDHLAAWLYQGKVDLAVLLAVVIWLVFGVRLASK